MNVAAVGSTAPAPVGRAPKILFAGVCVALLGSFPFAANAYFTTILFNVLIAFILAQSWDWVAGEMGYINLGHYGFYGIGAYAFAIALVAQWPMPIALVSAAVLTAVIAYALSFPIFRLKGDYFAFATLALLPLLGLLASNLKQITGGSEGVVLPVASVLKPAYLTALGVAVVAFVATIVLNAARFGFALKSIRNDEQVAETLGVRIAPAKRAVLVLSALFAAVAGGLQAWQLSFIDPHTVFGLGVALVPVAMVLFAGSGLRYGPMVGVIVLSILQQTLLVGVQGYQATLYGLAVLLIGRFVPGGLLRAKWLGRMPGIGLLARSHSHALAAPRKPSSEGRPAAGLPIEKHATGGGEPLIELVGVTKQFGGNVAINDVNLKIMPGEIVGLIGTNGSGKTTLFNCISRVLTPSSGSVRFAGRDLVDLRRDDVARLGVGRTYQIPRPFGDLTVQENVAIPLMFGVDRLPPREAMHEARTFVEFSELASSMNARADSLSVQQRKALEFARALACKPRLLLVDEVASGLTPPEIKRFVDHIRHVRDRYGITVIWVEHIFSALERVVDRVIVLEQGTLIADGTLAEVLRDERVVQNYLGRSAQKPPPAGSGAEAP